MMTCKSTEEVAGIRASGRITAAVMEDVKAALAVGRTTKELATIAEDAILRHGATSASKRY
jgi:methionine aminopeptidase